MKICDKITILVRSSEHVSTYAHSCCHPGRFCCSWWWGRLVWTASRVNRRYVATLLYLFLHSRSWCIVPVADNPTRPWKGILSSMHTYYNRSYLRSCPFHASSLWCSLFRHELNRWQFNVFVASGEGNVVGCGIRLPRANSCLQKAQENGHNTLVNTRNARFSKRRMPAGHACALFASQPPYVLSWWWWW